MAGRTYSEVKIHGLEETCQSLLKLPMLYRQKVVYYALNKCAGLLKAQVIRNLVNLGLVDTRNLMKSIKVAPGRVDNKQLQACVLVGIKRLQNSRRIFGKAARKAVGNQKDLIRRLKKIGAMSAFYGVALEKGWMVKTKGGRKKISGFHFFGEAMIVTRNIIEKVYAQYLKDKLPEIVALAATGRGRYRKAA